MRWQAQDEEGAVLRDQLNPISLSFKAFNCCLIIQHGNHDIPVGGLFLGPNDDEIAWCLQMLKKSHGGTGFMHESFHQDDPDRFTRAWFAWANTLFGELVLKVYRERPHLLKEG